MPESVSLTVGGRTMVIETGELAKQANGSALVRYGDQNVVLCAVTASEKPREGIDFFPLTCDFEEKMYAAGKIPGGYIKREGRPPEHAVLSSRQIDRPIRPLFPDGFRNDVQIVATVFSVDPELDADVLGVCAAGAALALSDIPFDRTVAAVRVGRDESGQYICNPTLPQYETGGMDIVIAGTADAVMMVEGGGDEIDEEDFLGAVEFAHGEIRKIVAAIDGLAKKAGKRKREFPVTAVDPDLERWLRKNFGKDVAKAMRIVDKHKREAAFGELNVDEALARCGKKDDAVKALLESPSSAKEFYKVIKAMEEDELRTMVVDEKIRPDGRKPDEVRPIWCKVHYVPRVHGSGIFTRGQTQVFTAATLGSTSDAQRLDGIVALEDKRYMHFYNFPPYSVGETRPMRGPGRREIGHGHLAERALEPLLPPKDEFPYTLRLISEVLESNGSSSMASVCGSTLALMDAGVPIRDHVAGVAMGLILKGDKYAILTDIQGIEDALGEMDFKVAGTKKGITAIQMDIKVQGVTVAIMREAMQQARKSRHAIIDKLVETIAGPRAELSPYAPRMIVIKIDPAKIKDVIGPGGKVINKIIADTGVEKIDIEDDGSVFITSLNGAAGDKAKQIVENLTKEVVVGETYRGTVTRIITIGAFVQILPGKEGLVHISQLAPTRVEKVEDVVKVGDEIMVKVVEIDSQGRVNLSRKALLGGVSANGDYAGRGPRPPREPREPSAASAPGAPPTRRRRRPHGRHDE
ncbi:MAG: polyribonucleotide nucleotidyltransferase [Candidatus Eremiobacteraeota bacterium]|nr:polyribonucleotide nucleotidyltransferase [Candidatus Eremiobacteraeota bacterium]MBV8498977.1 polyribonucleotide nucleotidyltransferase [Candidatus Eremiobacteraeota bacterium]